MFEPVWISGRNYSTTLDTSNDLTLDGEFAGKYAKDAFGYMLGYYKGDFKRARNNTYSPFSSGNNALPSYKQGTKNLYNGNITSIMSQTRSSGHNRQYEQLVSRSFEYDERQRLKESVLHPYDAVNQSYLSTNDFKSTYSYDPNGNIRSLERNGFNGSSTQLAMDNLTYHYSRGDNKLDYIDDAVATSNTYSSDIKDQSSGNYQYDATGNLTDDNAEGLTIQWNNQGKVKQVDRTQGANLTINYMYDASGRRVEWGK